MTSIMANIRSYPVKNISVSINRPVKEVYAFASNPDNFPVWVEFIITMTKVSGNLWYAETDLGNSKIEFIPPNSFGIIDHWVTLPDGTIVYNPMRVIENAQGSEFVFTLFKMPYMTDETFEQDGKAVAKDLGTLKEILERRK